LTLLMEFGLHALGIGSGARSEVIAQVARSAEAAGFATLWAGEHVVMVDAPASVYPYSADGRIAVPTDADWLDPMLTLGHAAAVTERIGLATGILLLPEHNPVIVAKQAATLDVLSRGRFSLGVGVGWSREEFAALGIPFARRGARTREYVAAMRTLWRDDRGSFNGEFVSFDAIHVNPKPFTDRGVPIILGGNSDAALQRVADWADGWYGFNLASVDAVHERLEFLNSACERSQRNRDALRIAVAVAAAKPADVDALAELGVDELVLVEAPPADADLVADWIAGLAARWRLNRS
jgi:probable F420-dependent oxidoreductase